MPRKLREPTDAATESRVAQAFIDEVQKVASRIAGEEGEPPGSAPLGDAQAVRMWGRTDPNVRYDEMLTRIMTEGIPPDEMQQYICAEELPPDVLAMYGHAMPFEFAHQLATMAEYPFRWSICIEPFDDPEEQVKEAERLDRLWQKTLPQPAVEDVDESAQPEMPAPDPMTAQPAPQPQVMPQTTPAAPPPVPEPAMTMMGG